MARVVVLGSGFAGHTAAMNLRRKLNKKHEVVVVTPQKKFGYIPSYIWVGIGKMTAEQTQFELAPVYKKLGITYVQALTKEIHPDKEEQFIIVEKSSDGKIEKINYDYLINATGPRNNYAATPGLGPDGFTHSVCTPTHAEEAAKKYEEVIKKLEAGEKQRIVIGTGHGMATCHGAAFEYIHNLAFDLEERGLLKNARIKWISNEPYLGDFGVGGIIVSKGGYEISDKVFAESSFVERGIDWIVRAHVKEVTKDKIHYITVEGEEDSLEFDFAMLIPAFSGADLKYIDKEGNDITANLCNPSGFLKVDADYEAAAKGFENWKAKDWPKTYQTPTYPNLFAAGISFAPPHPISKPLSAPDGTPIVASPPRTGMVAGIIGHTVAHNVIDLIHGRVPQHSASMAEFGAACVASMGNSLTKGQAMAISMFPVVPDYDRFSTGRDLSYTFGDMGLAGHWLKLILHYMFIYKMKAHPLWWIIPD